MAGYGDHDTMAGGKGMSPRKAMAGGDGEGGFGVQSYDAAQRATTTNADANAGLHRKGAMEDHERGIGKMVHHSANHHPAQAAPDHGPTHPGGHHMDHYTTHEGAHVDGGHHDETRQHGHRPKKMRHGGRKE